ncbi:MAG TPA: FAD-binding oxidoreductase [Steroidobacteraceae bacterium]
MASRVVSSWGNVIHAPHVVYGLHERHDSFPTLPGSGTVLPFGNGRSYGDSCLNVGGALLQTRSLDRFIRFDRDTGVLACEAGVLLGDILRLAVPAGWFLPVVPGTSYITVGGAIANDVHGKNHHRAGTFALHVRRFELLRSDGARLVCSVSDNSDWFAATVGGLGLTGAITWVELQLRPIRGPRLDVESVRFANLAEFFELCGEAERDHEYAVAWIDCLSRGRRLGRGILQCANHAQEQTSAQASSDRKVAVPFPSPVSLVNAVSLRIFNTLHYHRQRRQRRRTNEDFGRFFFPLDRILQWNRLYGPAGFYQYQCVVPKAVGREATMELLETIAASGLGSFLAVLKRFGPAVSPGMLSFPRAGVTLALDFPNKGAAVERLFQSLDRIVAAAGGALYPAKDGRMPGALFRSGYPRWQEFSRYIDPACSSSFWRRVAENT